MADTPKPIAASEYASEREIKLLEEYNRLLEKRVELLAAGSRESENELRNVNSKILQRQREIELEADMMYQRKQRIEALKVEGIFEAKTEEREKKKLELRRLELEFKRKQKTIDEESYRAELKSLELDEKRLGIKRGIFALTDKITGGLFNQYREIFSINGILTAMGDSFSSILSSNADYAKMTGQIADRSSDFGRNLSEFGLGYAQVSKAAGELFVNFSGFSEMSKEASEQLATSAAKLELLGVSASITGKNIDDMTKSLGMTEEAAKNMNETLAREAMGAGIAVSKMAGDFSGAMSRLAAYSGPQAIKTFVDLEKQSKSLGIEMGKLNGIVGETWDTFEGSAKAAAGLNAILGGNYLNSVEMLNATESERVLLLKEALDASGKTFDSMGKYEKKAIAARLGISDLNDASKLFNKTTTQLTMDMEKRAASEEELAATQKEAAAVLDQLKASMNLVVKAMAPVADAIKTLINGFTWLNDKLNGWPAIIIALITVFGGLFTVFGSLMGSISSISAGWSVLTGAMTATTAAAPAAAGSITTLTGSISTMGTAITGVLVKLSSATASIPIILAIGVAFMMVGAAIAIAAYGMSLLVKSFAELEGQQIMAAAASILFFTIAIVALSAAMYGLAVSGVGEIAIVLLLAFGVAFVLIGMAISIASQGLATFINSFKGLEPEALSEVSKSIGMLSIAIIGLSLAMLGLVITGTGPVAIGLLLAFGAAFVIISFAANNASIGLTKIISSVSEIYESLTKENVELIYSFSKALLFLNASLIAMPFAALGSMFSMGGTSHIVKLIKQIGEALNELPEEKIVAISTLTETINTAKTVTEDELKPTKDFIRTVKEYYEVQATSRDADKDALVAALKEVMNVNNASSANNETTLVIEGNELVEYLKGNRNSGISMKRRTSDALHGPP